MINSIKNNIPNVISILRVILTIPIYYIFIYYNNILYKFLGFILLSFAIFTDYIDGLLARKLNVVSIIGSFIDPIADKLLVIFTFISLDIHCRYYNYGNILYYYEILFIIIILRDLNISILRFYFFNIKLDPIFLSKIKTTLIYFVLLIMTLSLTFSISLNNNIFLYLLMILILTVCISLYTLFLYLNKIFYE